MWFPILQLSNSVLKFICDYLLCSCVTEQCEIWYLWKKSCISINVKLIEPIILSYFCWQNWSLCHLQGVSRIVFGGDSEYNPVVHQISHHLKSMSHKILRVSNLLFMWELKSIVHVQSEHIKKTNNHYYIT